jgi:hypothetical protein
MPAPETERHREIPERERPEQERWPERHPQLRRVSTALVVLIAVVIVAAFLLLLIYLPRT